MARSADCQYRSFRMRTAVVLACMSFFIALTASDCDHASVDLSGYIFFCPCHGRFGNQADQFLGVLEFARYLNRTLILPPWRHYSSMGRQYNVEFDKFFQVEPICQRQRVLLARDFLSSVSGSSIAQQVWPASKRYAYCTEYAARMQGGKCDFNEGQAQSGFWDELGIDFHSDVILNKQVSFDVSSSAQWSEFYPGDAHPVIALKGPPAAFPTPKELWHLQRCLQWTESFVDESRALLQATHPSFTPYAYISVHLRNHEDWVRASEFITQHNLTKLMASAQCIDDSGSFELTPEICLPPADAVASKIYEAVVETGLTRILVATDRNPMVKEINAYLHKKGVENVSIAFLDPKWPQTDLVLLGEAKLFIGNCVSSFTSFVRKWRSVRNLPTWYFNVNGEFL